PASSAATCRATSAPPATASEPPSQKSFCTSTTIRAWAPRLSRSAMSASLISHPRCVRVVDRTVLIEVGRLDHRLSSGHLQRVQRQLTARADMPLPSGSKVLLADDLASTDERHQQVAVVVITGRWPADADQLELSGALLVQPTQGE